MWHLSLEKGLVAWLSLSEECFLGVFLQEREGALCFHSMLLPAAFLWRTAGSLLWALLMPAMGMVGFSVTASVPALLSALTAVLTAHGRRCSCAWMQFGSPPYVSARTFVSKTPWAERFVSRSRREGERYTSNPGCCCPAENPQASGEVGDGLLLERVRQPNYAARLEEPGTGSL